MGGFVKRIFLLHIFFPLIVGQNYSDKMHFMRKSFFQNHQQRLITFNTQDSGDISIELSFNVPFITIPVKKSLTMAQGALANVNIGAVVLAGAFVFGIAVFIPAVMTFMTKKMVSTASPLYKNLDSSNFNDLMRVIGDALMDNNVNVTACLQRVMCTSVKKASENDKTGRGSKSGNVIHKVAASDWLKKALANTYLKEPLQDGLKNRNCAKYIKNCKIPKQFFNSFMSLDNYL